MRVRYCETLLERISPCDVGGGNLSVDNKGQKIKDWHCTDEPMEENCRHIVDTSNLKCPSCGQVLGVGGAPHAHMTVELLRADVIDKEGRMISPETVKRMAETHELPIPIYASFDMPCVQIGEIVVLRYDPETKALLGDGVLFGKGEEKK